MYKNPKQLSLGLFPRKRPLGSRPALARRYHRELWSWLFENPGKEKFEWPKWRSSRNRNGIKNEGLYCFPCAVAKHRGNMNMEKKLHAKMRGLDVHCHIPACCQFCPVKAWASIATGYNEEYEHGEAAPCEVVGPYARWQELMGAHKTKKAFSKLTEKEENEFKRLISLAALAVAATWGSSSLNNGEYNTNH